MPVIGESGPLSAGPSTPWSFAPWQLAQRAAYSFAPVAACAVGYAPVPAAGAADGTAAASPAMIAAATAKHVARGRIRAASRTISGDPGPALGAAEVRNA